MPIAIPVPGTVSLLREGRLYCGSAQGFRKGSVHLPLTGSIWLDNQWLRDSSRKFVEGIVAAFGFVQSRGRELQSVHHQCRIEQGVLSLGSSLSPMLAHHALNQPY